MCLRDVQSAVGAGEGSQNQPCANASVDSRGDAAHADEMQQKIKVVATHTYIQGNGLTRRIIQRVRYVLPKKQK